MRERLHSLADRVRLDRRIVHATSLAAKAWHLVDFVARQTTEIEGRVQHLERVASIDSTMAWVERATVPTETLVSVVTVTKDRPELLARALESLRAQAYPNWELILVDDHSTPANAAAMARLVADDDRVTQVSAELHGLAAGRNSGRRAVSGQIVTYLDDDNEMHPLWLKAAVWAFQQRPEIDIFCGGRVIEDIHHAGGTAGRSFPTVHFEAVDSQVLERRMQSDGGCIAHRASVRTESDARFARSDDWDWLARATRDHSYEMLPCIAVFYATGTPDRLSTGVGRARG
ncbi:MAG: glycosyltransferase family A protein [Acidimicrobiales bacterium]|nr:glycosyltransferase family A protein [Acidimicrobiales bacterium]